MYFEGIFWVRLYGKKLFQMAAHNYILENEVYFYGLNFVSYSIQSLYQILVQTQGFMGW
jgi:hypothetical protein